MSAILVSIDDCHHGRQEQQLLRIAPNLTEIPLHLKSMPCDACAFAFSCGALQQQESCNPLGRQREAQEPLRARISSQCNSAIIYAAGNNTHISFVR